MNLNEFFSCHPRVAVAFSGGTDSSYLLYAAVSAGCCVHAYTVKSQFQPSFELDDARKLSETLGVPLTVIRLDALANPVVAFNKSDRCYHCKKAVLTAIWESARADGFAILCDGTNADDDEADRQGTRALRELEVASPLRDCGLTKADVRILSKQAGLFTHDKPSYACLATRIPTGTTITDELLEKAERAENALFGMGFTDFRVRFIPPNGAKLQFLDSQWGQAASKRGVIFNVLHKEYDNIMLDMATR